MSSSEAGNARSAYLAVDGASYRADPRIDALVSFTRAVVRVRGKVSSGTVDDFLARGFTKDELGEVFVGIGLKTISNYFNAVAGTPLDDAFEPQAWQAAAGFCEAALPVKCGVHLPLTFRGLFRASRAAAQPSVRALR